MNLNEFRQQNPAYSDKSTWPDDKLATGLYNKYYKDQMSMDDFGKSVGLAAPTTAPATDSQMSDEQWQTYADKNEAASKAQETGLEEPWVNPIDAVAGPLGMPARALVGKAIGKGISEALASQGLKKTATMVAASLAAEPITGTVMEQTEEAMTEAGVPLAIKLPVDLATGMITGTLAEGGLMKLGSTVKRALLAKGADASPEEVFKIMKSMKVEDADVTGSEDIIRSAVKRDAPQASMTDAVKAITKAKKDKGIDIPEIKAEDIVKSQGGEQLHGAVLGAGAGLTQDEEGNYSIDPKLMIGGTIAGAFAAQQVSKMFGSTRHPGQSGGVKQTAKRLRKWSNDLKQMGKAPKEIFRETGMWQAEDGRWRYEIDDSKAVVKVGQSIKLVDSQLGDILDHPELYKHYPQLETMQVKGPGPGWTKNNMGAFAPGRDPVKEVGVLFINPDSRDVPGTVLHEVQHAIQHIEGLERGGSPQMLNSAETVFRNKKKSLEAMLKTASPDEVKDIKKELKEVKRQRRNIGIGHHMDEYDKQIALRETLNDKQSVVRDKMYNLEDEGLNKSPEYVKLRKEYDNLKFQVIQANGEATMSKAAYTNAAHTRYEEIAGEREANAVMDRRLMSAEMRAEAYPKFENSVIVSNFLKSNVSAGTGAIGAVYGGVDWDTFEETGDIRVDPDQMLRGLLAGVAVGMGIKVAPKAASHWTAVTKSKIVDPLVDIAKGSITNETVRYQLGLGRSAEVRNMVRDYKTQADLVLRKAVTLGHELNDVAPTGLAQRRLTQILEGGITTNASLAKKAHKINAMFKDLKEATRDLNLSQYSRFDELTRKQRTELRQIIKDPDMSIAEVQTAQEILNNHYHIGSSKEYLPIFHPGVEGLTKADKNALNKEIKNLKKQSRYRNPEGNQTLEAQIAGLETYLKEGTKRKSRVRGVNIDRGYATMRQDIPAESTRVFNDIVGPAYRTAKGAATQAGDVLKMGVLNEVKKNPEWVLPKGGKTPANYIKLYGKQWGPLNGQRVRNDVLADLEEVIDVRSNAEMNMDKIMGYWKFGKAILNPVTHARNAVSNTILAYFAGVNPADTHTYASAAKALKQGRENVHFKEAEDWGLFNNTFIESDISALRDELNEIRDGSKFAKWIRNAVSAPAALYDQSERFFKTAVFINARESGKTIDEAAKHAEKYLFNYQDIPPAVKHYKRWAAPFMTYTYKATPLLAETMVTKPWKIGAVFGTMYGLEELAQKSLGMSDEDVAADKSVMLQDKGQVLLPFKDAYGNRLYGNMGAFMPWSGVGQTWGQSDVPLGDWLPSNPMFTIAAALVTNKESFTGKDIHDRVLDGAAETTQKYMSYAWKQLTPSLVPGGYGFEKIVKGLKNSLGKGEVDYAGRQRDISSLAMEALLGVKLTPANQKLFDQFTAAKVRKVQQAVRKRRSAIRRNLQRGKITREGADKQIQALRDLNLSKVSEQLKYK